MQLNSEALSKWRRIETLLRRAFQLPGLTFRGIIQVKEDRNLQNTAFQSLSFFLFRGIIQVKEDWNPLRGPIHTGILIFRGIIQVKEDWNALAGDFFDHAR